VQVLRKQRKVLVICSEMKQICNLMYVIDFNLFFDRLSQGMERQSLPPSALPVSCTLLGGGCMQHCNARLLLVRGNKPGDRVPG